MSAPAPSGAKPPASARGPDASAGDRPWHIIFTPQAEAWLNGLNRRDSERVESSVARLRETGPGLGRPSVDSIKRSRHHNMKELRSRGGHLRALFAFDPDRRAVILLGGDKAGNWKRWYRQQVPVADRLYDNHLRQMGKEPRWTARPRAGTRSEAGGP